MSSCRYCAAVNCTNAYYKREERQNLSFLDFLKKLRGIMGCITFTILFCES